MRTTIIAVIILLSATYQAGAVILINELDTDQEGTDSVEFVELYSTESTPVNLGTEKYAVVLYNGMDDTEYRYLDLTGVIAGNDYYVIGASTVPNVDHSLGSLTNIIQNGPDAIALFKGVSAAQFDGTVVSSPPVGAVLVDALVYDTSDADDIELLAALTPGEPQINENENGKGTVESIQRIPDGAGGPLDTSAFVASGPSPGNANSVADTTPPEIIAAFASGDNKISVFFNEPVEPASAETLSNYVLFDSLNSNKGNPSGALPGTAGQGIELTFAGVVYRSVYYLKVKNVTDLSSNTMPSEVVTNKLYACIQPISWAVEQFNDVVTRDTTVCISVKGTVTSPWQFGPGELVLQDDTAGLLIYSPAAEYPIDEFQMNDEILAAGFITQYYGRAEFINAALVELSDETGQVIPRKVMISEIDQSVENLLIEVADVLIDRDGDLLFAGDPSVGGNRYYYITDSSLRANALFIDKDNSIIGQTIPPDSINIRGIAGQFNGGEPNTGFFIAPRSMGDLDVVLSPTPTPPVPTTAVKDWEELK